jgi:hypothetical protein
MEARGEIVDEHNTTMETINEIRKKLQAQRATYEAIIDRAAQR